MKTADPAGRWILHTPRLIYFRSLGAILGLLVNPDRDLVAVFVAYKRDDQHSGNDTLAPLRAALEAVYGGMNNQDLNNNKN